MFKRIKIVILLCGMVVCSCDPAAVDDDGVHDNGQPDIETLIGDGSKESPYIICNADDIRFIQQRMSSSEVAYIELGADIDLSEVEEFVPFNNEYPYGQEIHLDGKEHKISNLVFDAEGRSGLFAQLNGSCCNLQIVNADVSSESGLVGILAAHIGSLTHPTVVDNVTVHGKVSSQADCAGGLAGVVENCTLSQCTADVTIESPSGKYLGGLVGQVKSGEVEIKDCVSGGELKGESYLGGLVGVSLRAASLEIESCTSNVSVVGLGDYVAGFAGYIDSKVATTILNCKANSSVESSGSWVSSFLSHASNGVTIDNCHAEGTLYGVNNIAGILACASSPETTVKNSGFAGEITGLSNLAGLVAYSDGKLLVENCYVTGEVVGINKNNNDVAQNVSGLVGEASAGSVTIKKSHFSGTLSGNHKIAGAVGYAINATVLLSEVYSTGYMQTIAQSVAGLVGQSNVDTKIINCWSSATIMGRYDRQHAAGLLAFASGNVHIENSFASGPVTHGRGVGGLVGRVNGDGSKTTIIKSIAWNPVVACPRVYYSGYLPSGAIAGSIQGTATFTDCYRRPDMEYADPFIPYLVDHENVVNSLPPLPEGHTDETIHHNYNGKAAPDGISLTSLAQSLDWDSGVWNFSESGDLRFAVSQLVENKIEF